MMDWQRKKINWKDADFITSVTKFMEKADVLMASMWAAIDVGAAKQPPHEFKKKFWGEWYFKQDEKIEAEFKKQFGLHPESLAKAVMIASGRIKYMKKHGQWKKFKEEYIDPVTNDSKIDVHDNVTNDTKPDIKDPTEVKK